MGILDGRVALVTGAGRGIGAQVALRLARDGADLVINDLDPEPLEETAAALRDLGRRVETVAGSVIEDGFAERFVTAATETLGGIHIIVNNAGFTWDNVIQKMTDEQWRTIYDVHVTAPFQILRAASEPIRIAAKKEAESGARRNRKVVNISSTSGVNGNAGQANYSSAKSAVMGLTKAMSKEWGRYGVNVNAVAFGLIDTRLTQPLGGEAAHIQVEDREIAVGIQADRLDAFSKMIPLGRAGTATEAAAAVAFFCGPDSDYVSGQVLVCGGGYG